MKERNDPSIDSAAVPGAVLKRGPRTGKKAQTMPRAGSIEVQMKMLYVSSVCMNIISEEKLPEWRRWEKDARKLISEILASRGMR